MADPIAQTLSDPAFQQMDFASQKKVMSAIDPEFGKLGDADALRVIKSQPSQSWSQQLLQKGVQPDQSQIAMQQHAQNLQQNWPSMLGKSMVEGALMGGGPESGFPGLGITNKLQGI